MPDKYVYDFFISYRREGAIETAQILKDKIEDKNFTVFFDNDTLKHGDFEKNIIDSLKSSKTFIPILNIRNAS